MIKYMGSKARLSKYIIPIITQDLGKFDFYWEPFVGGANSIRFVPNVIPRYGSDVCPYIIGLLQAIQNGWIPPEEIDEELYRNIKNHKEEYHDYVVGFAAYCSSYSGKFFGGYARGENRNYVEEQRKAVLKHKDKISDIIFSCNSYDSMSLPLGRGIIYCDPPYAGTTRYKNKFDHDKFWKWCDNKVLEGHKLFVSEYIAPPNWKCIFEKEQVSSLTQNTGAKKGVERLFTHE